MSNLHMPSPVCIILFSLKQAAPVLFSSDGALYELYKYAVEYSDGIISALREHDLIDQALSFQSIAETL